MDISILILVAIATFFNFIVLRFKFEHNRTDDAFLDAIVLIVIIYFTSGSVTGLIIGMIASALFSLYGLWKPFKLDKF